ncbi:MAG TPA: sigma-70 family RNA polymerase sigma factor [Mucilaginibacter sp.]|nr:sigma-70 family RNA polymerase sigma factor [Mucilaginibacter sp.]
MNITRQQAEKLVEGCINNERTAQEALYKLFHGEMLRVCYSYLSDVSLAKEALNSGFLKVFKSIKTFDARKGELGGWIRKIMVYSSIDLVRNELKFAAVKEYVADDDIFIEPSVLEKLRFEDILKHIRQLPYATQTVFNLSVLDGLTHKEIGEQLHISESTSRWHLSEAKRQLRSLLDKPGDDTSDPKERRGK